MLQYCKSNIQRKIKALLFEAGSTFGPWSHIPESQFLYWGSGRAGTNPLLPWGAQGLLFLTSAPSTPWEEGGEFFSQCPRKTKVPRLWEICLQFYMELEEGLGKSFITCPRFSVFHIPCLSCCFCQGLPRVTPMGSSVGRAVWERDSLEFVVSLSKLLRNQFKKA